MSCRSMTPETDGRPAGARSARVLGIRFTLIKGEIEQQTMPKIWGHLSNDEVWKMITYIRSLYQGDPSRVNW